MAEESLGTAVLALTTDDSGLERGLAGGKRRAQSWIGQVGGLLGKGVAVGAGVGAMAMGAVGAALIDATRAAMGAEEAQAALSAVLQSTGGVAGVTADTANDLASSLQAVTRFEDDAIIGAESLLLTFTSIGQEVFPDATETVLDMSQALGQDLKSSAIQLGKALNDPITGITALRRVGVNFTEQQLEQVKALQESGDLMGAQRLILAELRREFGGAAKAAGLTFAGQLDILNNRIGDVKESVGGALLPALTDLVAALGPLAIDAATGFGNWLAQVGPKISATATDMVKLVDAVRDYGLQSPQVRTLLADMLDVPESEVQKFQDVVGWIKTAADNIGELNAVIQDTGWLSPETFAVLVDTFGPDLALAIRDVTRFIGEDLPNAIATVNGWIDSLQQEFSDTRAVLADFWANPFDAIGASLAGAADALARLIGLQAQWNSMAGAGGASGGGSGGGGSRYGGAYAAGTLFAPGGLSLVGERGPELVNLPRGAQVFDAGLTERLFDRWRDRPASNTFNITIHAPGGEPRAVARASERGVLAAARAMGVR